MLSDAVGAGGDNAAAAAAAAVNGGGGGSGLCDGEGNELGPAAVMDGLTEAVRGAAAGGRGGGALADGMSGSGGADGSEGRQVVRGSRDGDKEGVDLTAAAAAGVEPDPMALRLLMAKPLALDGNDDDDGSTGAEDLARALERCTQWCAWDRGRGARAPGLAAMRMAEGCRACAAQVLPEPLWR